jgi:hypothetical protein
MKFFDFARYALGSCICVAVLSACGGASPPTAYAANGAAPAASHDQVFKYTGRPQSFKVPAGVTHLTITAYGANGAPGMVYPSGFASAGGSGRMVTATIPVTPGEELGIFVGGSGQRGGFNGGGQVVGSNCSKNCAAFGGDAGVGGGASDVRQGGDTLTDRVLVAAGGGGGGNDGYYSSGSSNGGAGGAAGGRKGASGEAGEGLLKGGGGAGATQRAGGKGGAGGAPSGGCGGSNGTLGAGGDAGPESGGCGANGGGGGGGYYGGGGGGAGGPGTDSDVGGSGGGGGGGSSFVEKDAKRVKMIDAANTADGSIVILW